MASASAPPCSIWGSRPARSTRCAPPRRGWRSNSRSPVSMPPCWSSSRNSGKSRRWIPGCGWMACRSRWGTSPPCCAAPSNSIGSARAAAVTSSLTARSRPRPRYGPSPWWPTATRGSGSAARSATAGSTSARLNRLSWSRPWDR